MDYTRIALYIAGYTCIRYEPFTNVRNIMGRITEKTGFFRFKMFIFQGFQGCGYGEPIKIS